MSFSEWIAVIGCGFVMTIAFCYLLFGGNGKK
jgi:hypothetical protein